MILKMIYHKAFVERDRQRLAAGGIAVKRKAS
jgi:hypothetical protein